MRNTTKAKSVELLLNVLYEGTESDGPWVKNRAVELEMEGLFFHEPLDMIVPYQYSLITIASDTARTV
ncbi:MAG: hypothetical protein U9R15_00680, partial [Chloroflexota bacterium]|nr:hypothetical protein [Chloroflexota bacterium]